MPCWELRFVLSVVFYVVNENPQNRIRSKGCKSKRKHQKSEDFRCCSVMPYHCRFLNPRLKNLMCKSEFSVLF